MTTTGTRFFTLSVTSPAYARLQEAEQFFVAGNLNEALAAAQQAWREYPQVSDVFRVLAYIHMARGEYAPAAQAAYQSVVVDAANPASYAILTQVYLAFNMLTNAEQTLATARQQFSDDPSLLVLEADLRFRQQKPRPAVDLALRTLSLNPDDAYARALLGVHYLRVRRYRDAAEMLRAAVVVYPHRWDYLRDLGIALLHTREYAAAREYLTSSYRLNSLDFSTKQHLSYAIRFTERSDRSGLAISFFFYDHAALGWVLNITGYCAGVIGLLWLIAAITRWPENAEDAWKPVLFTVIGVAAIWLTTHGLHMRRKHGTRFDRLISRAMRLADSK